MLGPRAGAQRGELIEQTVAAMRDQDFSGSSSSCSPMVARGTVRVKSLNAWRRPTRGSGFSTTSTASQPVDSTSRSGTLAVAGSCGWTPTPCIRRTTSRAGSGACSATGLGGSAAHRRRRDMAPCRAPFPWRSRRTPAAAGRANGAAAASDAMRSTSSMLGSSGASGSGRRCSIRWVGRAFGGQRGFRAGGEVPGAR